MNATVYGVRKHLYSLEKMSYVPEGEGEMLTEDLIDCSYGINPYGIPHAVEEMTESPIDMFNHYPAYPYTGLRQELERYWSEVAAVQAADFAIGAGSLGVLGTINRMFVEKGTQVLGYCPQFSEYITEVRYCGGEYRHITLRPERNYLFDAEELAAKIGNGYRLVYVDNPNNPTGQIIPIEEIRTLVRAAQAKKVCVIVDEAYGEFMPKANSAITLIREFDNLIVARTFSKGFGLAGLRVGYAACSERLMKYYKLVNTPFTVNETGCRAAVLALRDENFIRDSLERIADAKAQVIDVCRNIRVWATSATTPIMVLQHPAPAVDLAALLREHRVLAESGRDFMSMGQNAVRLRIPRQHEELLDILRRIDAAILPVG